MPYLSNCVTSESPKVDSVKGCAETANHAPVTYMQQITQRVALTVSDTMEVPDHMAGYVSLPAKMSVTRCLGILSENHRDVPEDLADVCAFLVSQ